MTWLDFLILSLIAGPILWFVIGYLNAWLDKLERKIELYRRR